MASPIDQPLSPSTSLWRRICIKLWSILRFFWLGIVLTVLLNIVASVIILSIDTKLLTLYFTIVLSWIASQQLVGTSVILVIVILTFISWVGSRLPPTIAHTNSPQQQNRTEILKNRAQVLKILHKAYTEQLRVSLQGMAHITLNLSERFDPAYPPRHSTEQSQQLKRIFADGSSIVDAFDQSGRGLLILGDPGAGKTTLLYELAEALLDWAEDNNAQPLPIVLHLSSWAQQRLSLEEWVVKELELRYVIPRRFGQHWIQQEQFLLLLDGLDEVAAPARAACIDEINAYHKKHLTSLVVCTRKEEYEAQPVRLTLQSAVIVQPLTTQQVNIYLKQAGKHLAVLNSAIRTNSVLEGLLKTPLMLTTMIQAYDDKTNRDVPKSGSAEMQQKQIFSTYLHRMLYSQDKLLTSPEQMQHWLVWLAKQMKQRSQSWLYLEQLQPDWLTGKWLQGLYNLCSVLLPGIVIGTLISFSIIILLFQPFGQDLLVLGLPGGLVGGLLSSKQMSSPILNKSQKRWYFLTLLGAAFFITELSVLWLDKGKDYAFFYSVLDGTIFGAWHLLLALAIIRWQQPSPGGSRSLTLISKWNLWRIFSTNKFLRYDLRVGLIVGLGYGLSYGLTYGLNIGLSSGLSYGIGYGLSTGLSLGLSYGLSGILISFLVSRKTSRIEPTEILVWSWRSLGRSLLRKNHLRNALIIGVGTTLVIGLSIGLHSGLDPGLRFGLVEGLDFGLRSGFDYGLSAGLSVGGSYWLLVGLFQGISNNVLQEKQRTTPNLGIRRSGRNGLILGMLCIAFTALVCGLGMLLSSGLSYGLFYGLGFKPIYDLGYELSTGLMIGWRAGFLVFLLGGGLAWWRHWVLRFLLWSTGAIPLNYSRMLDAAALHILLRKGGGGYSFIHDQFRDYLASLDLNVPSGTVPPLLPLAIINMFYFVFHAPNSLVYPQVSTMELTDEFSLCNR